jgi:putative NADH-flavin reductase
MASTHRILVLGGTGPTGRLIVAQALHAGHTVTAVSRHPGRLGLQEPALTLVSADVSADGAALGRVMSGHDVVISALGVGKGLRSGGLMARATPGILTAMEQHGVRRLVFVSAFGVGGTAPHAPLVFRFMFRVMLANVYADKAAAEAIIRQSACDWTILAPMLLTSAPPAGHARLVETEPTSGPWRVSRADVAAAALRCIDDVGTVRKRLVVAS